jgi:hypothetical protein
MRVAMVLLSTILELKFFSLSILLPQPYFPAAIASTYSAASTLNGQCGTECYINLVICIALICFPQRDPDTQRIGGRPLVGVDAPRPHAWKRVIVMSGFIPLSLRGLG